jgi:CBS-domain-containing membrane protein
MPIEELNPWGKKNRLSETADYIVTQDIPSDLRLSANLVPTFADRGCHVVSVTDPYGRILGFLDWSRYAFFQVAPQLYSRG